MEALRISLSAAILGAAATGVLDRWMETNVSEWVGAGIGFVGWHLTKNLGQLDVFRKRLITLLL